MLTTHALVLKAALGSDGQHAQHTSTAAGERGTSAVRIAVKVLLSICMLTMVALDIWSAADREVDASATTTRQQQHTSVSAYACSRLHSCVHAMGTLTWSVAAALPLCDARQFEFVRQRQALCLRNRDSLPERIAITIELQQR